MKFKNLVALLSVLLLIPVLASAHEGSDHDEEATVGAAVFHFASIGTALSGDSVEGVAEHAKGILAIMDAHMAEGGHHEKMAKMHGDKAEHGEMGDMEAMHKSMRDALATLAADGTDLEAARDAYKALGANFIPMAQKMYTKSEVDPNWAVMTCPMVKAEWIQVDGKVANPFFGSKMLSCGKKVADLADGGGHHMEGMKGDMNHEGHEMKGMKMDDSKESGEEHHHGG